MTAMTTPDVFLKSVNNKPRVVYYPGSWTDSSIFRVFAESGKVLSFIYSDYGIGYNGAIEFIHTLANQGWQAGEIENLQPRFFHVRSWESFWPPNNTNSRQFERPDNAFVIRTTLSRKNQTIDFMYLGTEGVQTYSVLSRARILPSVVVLQEHGFGSNWTKFGGDHELYRLAATHHSLPDLLFVAKGAETEPWPGYHQVSNFVVYEGSMHDDARALFQRDFQR
jgi:hypothetical protein